MPMARTTESHPLRITAMTLGDGRGRIGFSQCPGRIDRDAISGPFAPRALPRFNATTDPAATVSSSADFPVVPVIRLTLLQTFLPGTRTVSPVTWHVLVTVLSLPPRQRDMSHQLVCDIPCCLRPTRENSASGVYFCRGHRWVHSRYGPVTRSPPYRRLCQPASSASFPPLM